MSSARVAPVFVVGCSRSGTTLIQSILHQHPDFTSFPEANILYTILDDLDYRRYGRAVGRRRVPVFMLKRLANRLDHTWSYSPQVFRRFLKEVGREDLGHLVPPKSRSIREVYAAFDAIMIRIAGGKRYVEKTPQNIFCIEMIVRHVEGAKFVHIVRDGRETVASLSEATKKYVDFRCRFGGAGGLPKMIRYWNNCLMISYGYKHHRDHVVVRYEDVVAAPKRALQDVGAMLEIEITDDMLQYDTTGISLAKEEWKKRSSNKIAPQADKFRTAFSEAEKSMVDELIRDVGDYFPTRFVGGAKAAKSWELPEPAPAVPQETHSYS